MAADARPIFANVRELPPLDSVSRPESGFSWPSRFWYRQGPDKRLPASHRAILEDRLSQGIGLPADIRCSRHPIDPLPLLLSGIGGEER